MSGAAQLRVLRTFKGSPDGITVHIFAEGETITRDDARMSAELWSTAVREGWLGAAAPKPTNTKRTRKK